MLEETSTMNKEIDFRNLVANMQGERGDRGLERLEKGVERQGQEREVEELMNLILTNNDLDAVKQLLSINEEAVGFFLRKLFQNYASGDPSPQFPSSWMTVNDLISFYILIERPRDIDGAEIQLNMRYMSMMRGE